MSVVCCQVEVSDTNWSLVQRSPTDWGASLCVIKKPRTRGGYSPARGLQNTNLQWVVAPVGNKSFLIHYFLHEWIRTEVFCDINLTDCYRLWETFPCIGIWVRNIMFYIVKLSSIYFGGRLRCYNWVNKPLFSDKFSNKNTCHSHHQRVLDFWHYFHNLQTVPGWQNEGKGMEHTIYKSVVRSMQIKYVLLLSSSY